MASPAPAPADPNRPRRSPVGSIPRLWLWLGLAFVAGLLLFALAIGRGKDRSFFRAGDVPPATAEPDYAPLPAPMADADAPVIGSIEPPPREEAPPFQAPRAEAPRPVAPPVERAPPRPQVADRKPRPLPGQTPSPEYPMRALRNGDRGTVLVQVNIGPDGVPTSTQLVQSSGSRDLDRAALQGVRGWRFEPAISDGHPSVGQVVVPIDFKLSD